MNRLVSDRQTPGRRSDLSQDAVANIERPNQRVRASGVRAVTQNDSNRRLVDALYDPSGLFRHAQGVLCAQIASCSASEGHVAKVVSCLVNEAG